MTVNGVTSLFSYDASNALTTLASNDGTDVTVYVYDQGLLATETQTQTKA